jgi:glycosyltransferase involved in cell wall biosynthesis
MIRELNTGGCERDLARIATRLDREQFEVHVGCFYEHGFRRQELDAAGIPVTQFDLRGYFSWGAIRNMWALARFLRRHKIRLIHSYDVPSHLFSTPVAWLCRTRWVVASQLSYRSLRDSVVAFRLRLCDWLTDRTVVNCKAMERHMVDDEGYPADRVFLCYNGVDTSDFHPRRRLDPRPECVRDATLVIGSVCVLRREKRLDLLLEAFARIRHRQPGAKLLIVGSGPELEGLQRQRDRLGLETDCEFVPATNEVSRWLAAMDIFVIPSDSEAFSNALLEAMASGCCPVGSHVGGMPELIAPGERGLLFPVGDAAALAAALETLILDPDLRRRCAEAAVRFSHGQLTAASSAQRMQSLYEQLRRESADR